HADISLETPRKMTLIVKAAQVADFTQRYIGGSQQSPRLLDLQAARIVAHGRTEHAAEFARQMHGVDPDLARNLLQPQTLIAVMQKITGAQQRWRRFAYWKPSPSIHLDQQIEDKTFNRKWAGLIGFLKLTEQLLGERSRIPRHV